MPSTVPSLFPDLAANAAVTGDREDTESLRHATGIVPAQGIRELLRDKHVQSLDPMGEDQIQPASLDLRLGDVAYRVRASFLPGVGETVADRLRLYAMHKVDLRGGALFEKNCVYIVPLMECVHFGKRMSGFANPKSSTGRLDVFVRLITDGGAERAAEFDRVREAYKGPFYAEISPRAFSVILNSGDRLNQLRVRRGNPTASDSAMRRLDDAVGLTDAHVKRIDGGLPITADLSGIDGEPVIGYRAKPHAGAIEMAKAGHYAIDDFWDPISAPRGGGLILNPGDFYILASRERVRVPPDHAAEMVPYDTLVGEFRVHYAGFFDPGFGWRDDGDTGTRAVLEVRSHEVPFVLEDGQVVGRLVYERLTEVPDKLYGAGIGSNYQHQGLALAKQFRRV